ncbi:MAG: Ig-like domain-containing protein [Bacillota bacterium]
MNRILKRITLFLMVFLLSLCLTSQLLAAPPGQGKKADSEKHQFRHQSQEERKIAPPGLQDGRTPPGLVDKGGLPPGLHGRSLDELPPGIRNNRNFQEAIKKLREKEEEKKKVFTLSVVGSKFIIIPDEDATTATYKAVLTDEAGNKEEVTASWKLLHDKDGVSIDRKGVLEITASAEPGTVTLVADYTTGEGDAEKTYRGSLTVELYKQVVGAIKIEGKQFVALKGDETEPLQLAYTATVKDQEGRAIPDKEVTWSVETTAELELADGKVTIAKLPERGEEITFTLRAKYMVDGEVFKSTSLTVIVYYPVVNNIIITGNSEITLPDQGKEVTEEYEAVVVDQHGQKMEKEVVWFLSDSLPGVTLDDGILTVTGEAARGSFWLWVFNEVISGFEVTIV